jgi:hypothetical protein
MNKNLNPKQGIYKELFRFYVYFEEVVQILDIFL